MHPFRKFLSALLHPTPSLGRLDTNLRYTDILFGFVLKELFIRLQYIVTIPWELKLHLLTGTVLNGTKLRGI